MSGADTVSDMITTECRDKIGQLIAPGAYIAYGSLRGRSAALNVGRVLKIVYEKPKSFSYSDGWKITVVHAGNIWCGGQSAFGISNKGVLSFPERILVLNPDLISGTKYDILSAVEIPKETK